MKEMTEKEVLERKILLNQQAYYQVSEFRKEHHREQIRILRRKLWELNDNRSLKNEAAGSMENRQLAAYESATSARF